MVVAGHGMVGHRFVQSLRNHDSGGDWDVVVIGEGRPAYDRVALSSYVGSWQRDSLWRSTATPTGDEAVTSHLGELVTAIDRSAKQVTTDSGRVVGYDTGPGDGLVRLRPARHRSRPPAVLRLPHPR